MSNNTEKVYNILLEHEYMKRETICKKSGVDISVLSSIMTSLRRQGLAECTGHLRSHGGLRWKRYPVDKPLFPPQPDHISRDPSPEATKRIDRLKPEPSSDQVLDLIEENLRELRQAIKRDSEKGKAATARLAALTKFLNKE